MEMKSDLYKSFPENMDYYSVPKEAYEYAGDMQMFEEMMFGFHIYLLV